MVIGNRVNWLAIALLLVLCPSLAQASDEETVAHFRQRVEPLLVEYCYGCHGYGANEGGMDFEALAADEQLIVQSRDKWWAVLKNVRAGVMPPYGEQHPSVEERQRLTDWIKQDAFGVDPASPDPGRVTIRRLNRVEYRNTIRDLMGVDFDTSVEFPPDDTGYGFDNIGDALSMSPLLMEKYIRAAEEIVARGVPRTGRVMAEQAIAGRQFVSREPDTTSLNDNQEVAERALGVEEQSDEEQRGQPVRGDNIDFFTPTRVFHSVEVAAAGTYRLQVVTRIRGGFGFVPGTSTVSISADGAILGQQEYAWEDSKEYVQEFEVQWEAGEHEVSLKLAPHSERPPAGRRGGRPTMTFQVQSVKVRGPLAPEHWTSVPEYVRFFGRDTSPVEDEMESSARKVLQEFASRAFRRPVDEPSLDRLVAIAKETYHLDEKSYEDGVAQAMVAVLASPRFLFRIEEDLAVGDAEHYPRIDEYSLASRLSYFLWSTMPDEELIALAEQGELRANLQAQLQRMTADEKFNAFVSNFVGQWLRARDVYHVEINVPVILGVDFDSQRNVGAGAPRFEGGLREAMRRETDMAFAHVAREDRSVLELIDSNYTFVNQALAEHYGIEGVEGREMRKVELPEGSPRGGIITHGTMLTVTSNPTRTSPVKRGLFILNNILGTPAPPPPAAVPELEESQEKLAEQGAQPTLKEVLELHRQDPLCSSCHSRFDPLGLALENFNAFAMWRDEEKGKPIESAGELITGESFADVKELKKVLTNERRLDFYRCLTQKLLTYALGRGLDYYDEHTVDQIVDKLEAENGRFSILLESVVQSAPFQRRRSQQATVAER